MRYTSRLHFVIESANIYFLKIIIFYIQIQTLE